MTGDATSQKPDRVLVVAPTARDGEITRNLLRSTGLSADFFQDLSHLSQEIEQGAGAILLTEDAIFASDIDQLVSAIKRQPAWSDLPVVMLMRGGMQSPAAARVLGSLQNVTLLERPAAMRSVVSVVEAAVRARRRQYQIRDQFEEVTRANRIARRNEQLYMAIGESISYGVWVADLNGRNSYASKSFLELVGMTQEQCSSMGWASVLHPDELQDTIAAWKECIRSGSNWYREHRFKGVDGLWHPVLACGVPIRDERGIITQYAGINLDISRLKEAQESERSARLEAERISQMKDEFLATLSHELRTPLNAILGWSQLLTMGNQDPGDLQQGLEAIERNARAQTQLIEDLLDMSRIISGKLRLDIQSIDPVNFIEAAIETVRPAAEARNIRLVKVLDPNAGPISGDPGRLQQVIWNLLANAIKFTPRGGRVQATLERQTSHVKISVSDTGQGIKPEFIPRVFDRFSQADSSTTRRHGGLGLGLAIVKNLTELHGGSVYVSSEGENRGATFTISLPLAAVQHETDASPTAAPKPAAAHGIDRTATQLHGLKIVVVDDEPDARDLIRRALEGSGAEVKTAASATEGMELLQELTPDVLVSDIGMPGMDGYEFLRRIRSMGPQLKSSRVPAIALTAFARSEDRARAMLAGYQIHLAKPVEPLELLATIATVAGRNNLKS